MPKCPPGCDCPRHRTLPCPPGCDCGKHKPSFRRGQHLSDETKAKVSAARKGKGRGACPPGCECGLHNKPSTLPTDPVELREYKNARHRAWYARNPRPKEEAWRAHLWTRHRMTPEEWDAMRDSQRGRCCYCERPLPEDRRKIHVDHDHSCTCGPDRSCQYCRRGLACDTCNTYVGKLGEDWDRMERIAANGRRLKVAAVARINGKAVQGELPLNVVAIKRTAESA